MIPPPLFEPTHRGGCGLGYTTGAQKRLRLTHAWWRASDLLSDRRPTLLANHLGFIRGALAPQKECICWQPGRPRRCHSKSLSGVGRSSGISSEGPVMGGCSAITFSILPSARSLDSRWQAGTPLPEPPGERRRPSSSRVGTGMGTISARPSGSFPRTAPRARGTLASLLLPHHYRHYCWTKAALRVACRSLSPTTLLSRRHLGFCPCVLSPSLPPSPFYVAAPHRPLLSAFSFLFILSQLATNLFPYKAAAIFVLGHYLWQRGSSGAAGQTITG